MKTVGIQCQRHLLRILHNVLGLSAQFQLVLGTWLDSTLTWYSWKIHVSGPIPACASHLPPHVRGFVDNIVSHIRNSKRCMTIYNIDWIWWTGFVLDTTLTTFIGYGERLPCVSACGSLVLLDKDVGFRFILMKSWYLVQKKIAISFYIFLYVRVIQSLICLKGFWTSPKKTLNHKRPNLCLWSVFSESVPLLVTVADNNADWFYG